MLAVALRLIVLSKSVICKRCSGFTGEHKFTDKKCKYLIGEHFLLQDCVDELSHKLSELQDNVNKIILNAQVKR